MPAQFFAVWEGVLMTRGFLALALLTGSISMWVGIVPSPSSVPNASAITLGFAITAGLCAVASAICYAADALSKK